MRKTEELDIVCKLCNNMLGADTEVLPLLVQTINYTVNAAVLLPREYFCGSIIRFEFVV